MTRMIALALSIFLFSISVQAEEVKIKRANLTLNADLTMAAGKKMSDGIVLMVHGTMAHKGMEIMVALRDLLAERGLSTLSINLSLAQNDRHSMYDCASSHRHLNDNALVEVGLWVDWLKAKGTGPITVLGHSRSGNQLARYLIGKPDKTVKRAVLVAPGLGGVDGGMARGYMKLMKKPLAPVLAKAEGLVKAGKGDELLQGVGLIYCAGANVAAATFVDYYQFKPDGDTTAIVNRIKIPVLVAAATDDKVNPILIRKMKGKVKGNVRMVIIEGAGHFFQDLFGEDLADAVAEFLSKGADG